MSPLTKKIVLEYKKLVKDLNEGRVSDYTHILDMISALYVRNYTKNPKFIDTYFLHL